VIRIKNAQMRPGVATLYEGSVMVSPVKTGGETMLAQDN